MDLLFRVSKSLLFSLIMFFSLRYMGVSTEASIVMSLIPLVLGTIGILVHISYIITGLVFIIACTSSLLPELHVSGKDLTEMAATATTKPVPVAAKPANIPDTTSKKNSAK